MPEVVVRLSEELYEKVQKVAESQKWEVEDVIADAVENIYGSIFALGAPADHGDRVCYPPRNRLSGLIPIYLAAFSYSPHRRGGRGDDHP